MGNIERNEFEKELSEVQVLILDIFKYVQKYLDDEKIDYFVLGGTLLGAVRHKGFIPWDDDIDIGIPRGQYEKFLDNIETVLPDYCKVETYKNCPEHHYYFSRIIDTRYSMKRTGSTKERNEYVWIDIFPLDGMPNNALIRKIHMFRILSVRAMYHMSCFDRVNLKRPNRPLSERIIIKFVEITGFGRNGDTRKKLDQLDKLFKKYPYEKSNYVANIMGQYKFKEMFPKKYYGKGALYPFEDIQIKGPIDYDAVLTQMYGDYMTPPKDSDKNAHAAYLND